MSERPAASGADEGDGSRDKGSEQPEGQTDEIRTSDMDLRNISAKFLIHSDLLENKTGKAHEPVIIELNIDYQGGLDEAWTATIKELRAVKCDENRLEEAQFKRSRYNVFARLTTDEMKSLSERSLDDPGAYPIFKIWRDEKLNTCIYRSLRTVKADACQVAFSADGQGIVVAVADSGIDGDHPHFAKHRNLLDLPKGIKHRDFTARRAEDERPLVDALGHGTHVAGIVAGLTTARDSKDRAERKRPKVMGLSYRQGAAGSQDKIAEIKELTGMVLAGIAPRAKLLSLRVITGQNDDLDNTSNLISALEYIESVNHPGKLMKVHCVNLSLAYRFDAIWYAAGQSPLCVAVDRLVRSGVVVVAAAGNDGSIELFPNGQRKRVGLDQSINDPGNAAEAITVGATHGDSPHRYGVSYFSSRGPTADGRAKPDLVAPGERILSAASGQSQELRNALAVAGEPWDAEKVYFEERTGTSMAAPHVAGAAAALLSVRNEFIEQPQRVKRILVDTCTDLGRKRDFQGAGLLDLMRAIQSV